MAGRRGGGEGESKDSQPSLTGKTEVPRTVTFEQFMRDEFPFRNVPDLEIQFKLYYAANRVAYRNNYREALLAWEKSLTGEEAA